MASVKLELLDTLVLSDDEQWRIVDKSYRAGKGASYAEADSAATFAGWVGEPAGQRSSRVRHAFNGGDFGRWTLTITFTTKKQ